MCGVVGIFAHGPRLSVDSSELLRISDHMTARGPDGSGMWLSADSKVGFGHRRLEIIGLGEQGAQPMVLDYCHRSSPAHLVITFNGEIYNHQELRHGLEGKGHLFKTSCDTEVLLHLYEEYRDELVEHVRGMYAFGIWDAGDQRLLLARDPFGIKPLYYADDGGIFRFASQVRALLSGGAVERSIDEGALAGFFILGSVPEPRTASRSVSSVPAGSTMTVTRHGAVTTRPFFSIVDELRRTSGMATEEDLAIAIGDSVRSHLVADVEVGVFLSGGVDSGAIAALAAEEMGRVSAITLGFEEFRGTHDDETVLAASTAMAYGADHIVERISYSESEGSLAKCLASMDQPSIDGLNTWLVSRAAHRSGLKVALSGIGGDELLGGYSTFVSVPKLRRRLQAAAAVPGLGRASRAILRAALPSSSPKIASVVEYSKSLELAWLLRRSVFLPWELGGVLGTDRAIAALEELRLEESVLRSVTQPDPGTDVARVAALEGSLYMRNQLLRDADWASMAHSLEIRVPLVDATLYRVAAARFRNWSPGTCKSPLSSAPKVPLPSEVLSRTKTGFSLPIQQWLAHSTWAKGLVTPISCELGGWSRRWAYLVALEFELVP